jgi:hypothetical protein
MSARIYRAPDQAVRHDFRGSSLRERRCKNPCRFEASVEALYLDKHLSRPTAAGFCLSLCDFLVREAANRWGGSTSQLCTQQNSKLDGTWHKQFPHGCSASFSRWRLWVARTAVIALSWGNQDPSYVIFYTGAGSMKSVVRLESSEPLSQAFEIPGPALNEKLVPMNDNSKLTSLSGENCEAGSILAPRDYNKPGNSHQIGLVVTIALCLIALATFNMLLLK